LEKRFVEASCGSQLHTANSEGDGHDWRTCQAERRGVTEQAGARFAVIGAGRQACYRRCGKQD